MGGILDKIFIDPSTLEGQPGGVVKILFLMVVYAFVLFKASNLISDGSELLLLIRREYIDDTVNRIGGPDGMQG